MTKHDGGPAFPADVRERSVIALGISNRACNALGGKGINTIGQLVQMTAAELQSVRQVGKTVFHEICKALGGCGLSLSDGVGLPIGRSDVETLAKDRTLRDYFAGQALVGATTYDSGWEDKYQPKLAVWCYGLMVTDKNVDPLFMNFYENVVGEYWPNERIHIENGYQDLAFPFDKINCPDISIEVNWSLDEYLGYLGTWSATTRYIQNNDHDPVSLWRPEFAEAWGNDDFKTISWPLTLIVGRMNK